MSDNGTPVYRVVIQDDWDPDLSWLDQSYLDPDSPDYSPTYRSAEDLAAGRDPIDPREYRNKDNHANYMVRLERACPSCGNFEIVDQIGGVDFYTPFGDDPETGVFELDDPRVNGYILQLVNEMLEQDRAA